MPLSSQEVDKRHEELLEWLRLEWPYQRSKFALEQEESNTSALTDMTRMDAWKGAIDNYYHQAMLLGVQNTKGRQRLAKACATLLAEVVFVTAMLGDLPEPGHSSTDDLVEWIR